MTTPNLPYEGLHRAHAIRTESAEDKSQKYCHWGTSRDKGTMYCRVGFKLLDAPFTGRIVYGDLYFTENTFERSAQSLRYMGLKSNSVLDANKEELDQIVSVDIKHETNEGKTYAKVAWVNRAGGGVVKVGAPVTRDQLMRFNQQMTSRLAAIQPVAGERASSAAPAPTGSSSGNGRAAAPHPNAPGADPNYGAPSSYDDDIPF